jgi:hypothetical protein
MKLFSIVENYWKLCKASLFDIEPEDYSDEEYFEDLDQETIDNEKKWGNIYYGRNIAWIGTAGKMVRADVNNIYPISGNIFDRTKIRSLVDKIAHAEERVYLYAPYGMVKKVDIQTIIESLEGYDHNPLTTGDDELDEYIKDKEEYLSIYDGEEKIEAQQEMEQELKKAIASNSGDLGEFIFQIRDGNHRAFAAKALGESYIWMSIAENQLMDIKEGDYYDSSYKELLQ